MSVVIFSYKIQDILTEVTKRTSYLGKMRNTEATPNLIDRMSLTDGERFLFDEFLDDAVQQTYDWLKAFGRNVKNACQIVPKYQDYLEYKDYGVQGAYPIGTPFSVACTATPDYDNNRISVKVPRKLVYKNTTSVDVSYATVCEYKIKTILAGTLPCEEVQTFRTQGSVLVGNNSTNLDLSATIGFQWNEGSSTHELVGVEISFMIVFMPRVFIKYKKGDYIEYHKDLSVPSAYDVYLITADCTNANWMDNAECLDADPRGRIVYTLEKTDYYDNNMFSSVDRNIKEAIVNYIIYRWLTYTKPDEGDMYFTRFEEYAQRAKLGMESETSVQQRRHNFF